MHFEPLVSHKHHLFYIYTQYCIYIVDQIKARPFAVIRTRQQLCDQNFVVEDHICDHHDVSTLFQWSLLRLN